MGLLLLVPALNVGIGCVSPGSLNASFTICLPSVEKWVVEIMNFTPSYPICLWDKDVIKFLGSQLSFLGGILSCW